MSTQAERCRFPVQSGLYGLQTHLLGEFRYGLIPEWVKPQTPAQPSSESNDARPVEQILRERQALAPKTESDAGPVFAVIRETNGCESDGHEYVTAPDHIVSKCNEYERSTEHSERMDELPLFGEYRGVGIEVELGAKGGVISVRLVAEYAH